MADRADFEHKAFPSIARLEFDTDLDRKTVMKAIAHLESLGLIAARRTAGQPTMYYLIGVEDRAQSSTKNGTCTKNGTSTKNGTPPVPKTGHHQSQKRDTNLSITNQEPKERGGNNENASVGGEPVAAKPRQRARSGEPRFSKPTLDQVADYCHERGNQIDPEKFHDYYTANGWRVGKSAMKDWKAAVRNWEKRNEEHQRAGGKRELSFDQNLERLKRRSGEIV